jgi:hypothetical protein
VPPEPLLVELNPRVMDAPPLRMALARLLKAEPPLVERGAEPEPLRAVLPVGPRWPVPLLRPPVPLPPLRVPL